MGSEEGVFVSYSHADDEPILDEQGWVTQLRGPLRTLLRQHLGTETKVWRDREFLRGNEDFARMIFLELEGVKLLVAVLSPSFLRSRWCLAELRKFHIEAERAGRLWIDGKCSIFKLCILPVPLEEQPPVLRRQNGYDFFVEQEGAPLTLRPRMHMEKYIQVLNRLASDMRWIIQRMGAGAVAPSIPSGPTIFLAETSWDLVEKREEIRGYLVQRGYVVMPGERLPLHASELESEVRRCLEQCQMSIHLIGASYGSVPESESESNVALQYRLAMERAEERDLSRLVWLRPKVKARDAKLRSLIESLWDDPRGAQIITQSLDHFKQQIEDHLESPDELIVKSGEAKGIYLVVESRDEPLARELRRHLVDCRFEVILSPVGVSGRKARKRHERFLQWCDGVLLLVGQANEQWVQAMHQDLLRLPGLGRDAPLLARAIYLAPPRTPVKESFEASTIEVIRGFDGFVPEQLDGFLNRLDERLAG